eukprot:gb/GEZN01024701.1/.p1 GENE.gb/GEZN01024701.1/~~gb/GEZN01024701.1/.p1  ORF type:complete len:169 (+),score=13.72 gb/GEZN01024701.1/:31-507(+)
MFFLPRDASHRESPDGRSPDDPLRIPFHSVSTPILPSHNSLTHTKKKSPSKARKMSIPKLPMKVRQTSEPGSPDSSASSEAPVDSNFSWGVGTDGPGQLQEEKPSLTGVLAVVARRERNISGSLQDDCSSENSEHGESDSRDEVHILRLRQESSNFED